MSARNLAFLPFAAQRPKNDPSAEDARASRSEARAPARFIHPESTISKIASFNGTGGPPVPKGRARNPFEESATGDAEDAELVGRATSGDRAALEALVLRHQAWIHNIAVRMVFNPHDAEDVTQEALVKVITKLGSFRGGSSFRTWVYRIVANHVLNMRQRSAEARSLTFASLGAAINGTPDLDPPDPNSAAVDARLLVEEVKIGCTTGMLLCLDRRQRLVFILGEMMGASDAVGGEIMDVTADNFRQLLARARRDLHNFMNNQCGLVNKANPCRCAKKTRGFIAQGQVDPSHMLFASERVQRVREVASARSRPRRLAKLTTPSKANTPPSIATIPSSSPRTRSTGSGTCWRARRCGRRSASAEKILRSFVTVARRLGPRERPTEPDGRDAPFFRGSPGTRSAERRNRVPEIEG